MHSGAGDTTQLVPGYPIRTPWDHSSVDNSPRPIAASHVLHRLLVPRHPPSALDNLTTKNKMLASTIQFSTNDPPTPPTPPTKHRHPTADVGGRACRTTETPNTPTPDHSRAGARVCCFRTSTGCLVTTTTSRTPTTSTPTPTTKGQEPTRPHRPRSRVVLVVDGPLPATVFASVSTHRAPRPDVRGPRAPYPLSREGAP
jgi:hypothetical protein